MSCTDEWSRIARNISKSLLFWKLGVDVFLFLSGLGMYYSLNINKSLSLKKWYIRRLKRVLIPYLIIETPYWLWYTVSHNLGVCDFVYYISMLSYWKEHVGLWFLALLIPLYALVPLMFRIFNLRFRFLYLILLILACMVLSQISPPPSPSENGRFGVCHIG